ncbi:MAG: NifB/NifX family molybdenum-iron cluster-binding protein [Candidatus Helarchaeota archaeon]
MILCFPTEGNKGLDDFIGEHFGRVPYFTLYDTEKDVVKVIDNRSEHRGGQGLPGEILSDLGINVLICRGAGRRALQIFIANGISVYFGATGKVKDALEAWKNNKLKLAAEGDHCQEHTFHDPNKHLN